MTGIDLSGLDALDGRFKKALQERPTLRRHMHEEVSAAIQEELRQSIGRSGIIERDRKLRGWQARYVGSRGGYAAVRPIGQADGGGTGSNSAGAITNYLESGHKVRPSKASATAGRKLRKSRARQQHVSGYGFYAETRNHAQRIALDAANSYADAFAERLGD